MWPRITILRYLFERVTLEVREKRIFCLLVFSTNSTETLFTVVNGLVNLCSNLQFKNYLDLL